MTLIRFALVMLPWTALAQPSADSVIRNDYVNALGGEQALKAVTSRITEGRFDNGRGLNDVFRLYEKAPNKRLTTIGREPTTSSQGSGRGYDGVIGWDRNFIGTGLRTLQGGELADLARDADFFGPLHLFDRCATLSADSPIEAGKQVRCVLSDQRNELYIFGASGLLSRKDIDLPGGGGTVSLRFEDYRRVDAILIPFRTTVVLPDGVAVTYLTERVRHNAAIDDAMFGRPAR